MSILAVMSSHDCLDLAVGRFMLAIPEEGPMWAAGAPWHPPDNACEIDSVAVNFNRNSTVVMNLCSMKLRVGFRET
jgi:hypothetical protein